MKKFLSMLMAFCLIFSLSACGKKEDPKDSKDNVAKVENTTTEKEEVISTKVVKKTIDVGNKDTEASSETAPESSEASESLKAENTSEEATAPSATADEKATSNGLWTNLYGNGFYMDNKNEIIQKKDIGDRRVLNWVFDPFCPACRSLKSHFQGKMSQVLGDDAVVFYRIVGFLGGRNEDDTSKRLAAYILGTAEKAPHLTNIFLNEIMTNYECVETDVGCTEDNYKEYFFKIGGTSEEWNEIIKNKDSLEKMVEEGTDAFFSDPHTISLSPKNGSLYVPFLYMEGADKALDLGEAVDIVEFLTKAVHQ